MPASAHGTSWTLHFGQLVSGKRTFKKGRELPHLTRCSLRMRVTSGGPYNDPERYRGALEDAVMMNAAPSDLRASEISES
jgi:hypothetical protein